MANLFQDSGKIDANKRRFRFIISTGYSPAKEKGWSRMRGAGISPREAFNMGDADDCVDSNKEEGRGVQLCTTKAGHNNSLIECVMH